MKKTILTLITIVSTIICNGQSDTIFSNNEKILCSVREITSEAVKYSLLEEELTNSLYKNAVQKIVFKNGRTQIFSESSSFKKVLNVMDYEKVSISQLEGEVKGLYKLGEVSSKAEGGTSMSNQERVKERAYRKLKIQAAMQGANCIYLTHQRTQGNRSGGIFQSDMPSETNLSGIAYTTELPSYADFEKLISEEKEFNAVHEYILWSDMANISQTKIQKKFSVTKVYNENGQIILEGKLSCVRNYSRFRVVSFTKDHFTIFYKDKNSIHSIKIEL